MPDPLAPASFIFNSLASGEVSPALYGRTDLAKFHSGAFTMRNFFVDYKGGAKSRPGTQFLGQSNNANQYVRLYPFKFSPSIGQTYMLVFSNNLLEFIKNPGGASYPNSSNSGFILSGGVHYTVSTPYTLADLPALKFSQLADILTIVHPNYPRYQLSRLADTNWTLTVEMDTIPIGSPVGTNVVITARPTGSTDPQQTFYIYAVSAVDMNGNESVPSPPFGGGPGIDIGATLGTVTVSWQAVNGAQYYKVYKGLPTSGNTLPTYSQTLGFAGYSYGTSFTDSNVVPDFARTTLRHNDPFSTGQITGYSITATGSGYDTNPQNTTIVVTTYPGDPAPVTPAVIYPVMGSNVALSTTGVVGLWIADPGQGYLHPPTISTTSTSGGGFAATVTLNPQSGTYPSVAGLFQQREIYAGTLNQPSTLWGSRSGAPNDFRVRNPVVDDDSFEFTIASPQVTKILWLQSMPGGLVVGTDSGIVQLTGGTTSALNPTAVTPTSGVIVPQTYFGAADVPPIVIDRDILYVQSEASIVRDLQYQLYFNIYTGVDVTTLSSHLFYPLSIVQWAYQDTPNKAIWAIRNDGVLLSLTFLKDQEIMGWARHDTGGTFESIASVQEGPMDAVYVSVNRNGARCIERLADQVFYSVEDAWCLDAALSTASNYPAASILVSGHTGNVTITASAGVFSPGNVGSVIRAVASKATITGYISPTQVTATTVPGYGFGSLSVLQGGWRMDPVVSTVSGLTHLNGFTVNALVDGAPQGPFTVSGGAITLTTPGSQVVVGIAFQAQVQPVYPDLGQEAGTIQGRRKKVAAATIRVKDTARIKFGTDFNNLREWALGTSGTDPADPLPDQMPGLYTGDQRMVINQTFNRLGTVAIQQDYPLPATVLAVIPELAQGDTR